MPGVRFIYEVGKKIVGQMDLADKADEPQDSLEIRVKKAGEHEAK